MCFRNCTVRLTFAKPFTVQRHTRRADKPAHATVEERERVASDGWVGCGTDVRSRLDLAKSC